MKSRELNVVELMLWSTSPARDYVDRCLKLANWREGDSPLNLSFIHAALMAGMDELDRGRGAYWYKSSGTRISMIARGDEKIALGDDKSNQVVAINEAGLALRDRLKRTLEGFVGRPARRSSPWRAIANSAIESVSVHTTLELREDGVLEHKHRYVPKDHDGVVGLLLAFLMDPTKPAGGEVRVCGLASCGQFFVARKNPKGGPRRRYCTEEHQALADAQAATVRMRERREAERRQRRTTARARRRGV